MRTVEMQGEEQDIQNVIETIRQRFIQESRGDSYGSRQRVSSNERDTGYNQRSDSSRGGYGRNYEQPRNDREQYQNREFRSNRGSFTDNNNYGNFNQRPDNRYNSSNNN